MIRFTALFLLAASTLAQAPIVTTILSNGPTANRYDMVILAEGYTAAEQTRFNTDCQSFLTALFQRAPYQAFASYYNVHTVFRASLESGADHPDVSPPIWRNTVYNASYNTGGTARCLYIGNASQALADAALAPANEGRVLVFVNDSRYGGCAGQFAVSYNGSSANEVQIHEIGHSLASLADEYDYPNATYTGGEPGQVNITASPTGQKWSYWHGFDGISAFQGAGYYQYGLYRPKNNCLMRSLGVALCAVCKEQIARSVSSVVNVLENPQPAATSLPLNVGAVQTFSFTNLVPAANTSAITWRLDGQLLAGQNGTSFVLDTAPLTLGTHTVVATVQDLTALVRQDPSNTMRDSRTWTVTITDPTATNLRPTQVMPSLLFVQQGQEVDFTTVVSNDGPNPAGAFSVEHFLSADNALSPATDIYLGGYDLTGMAANTTNTNLRRLRIPNATPIGTWYVLVIVDRSNAIRESNENDNLRANVEFVQAGGCTPTLEFDDALLWPRDAAAVSLPNGGTVHPTVIARCAAPGTLYLLLWGCQGTTPGTTLAPGVTVPLNQDLCTLLGLGALNGAIFQQFWGTLDAQGRGRATFAWPAGMNMLPQAGHFAGVLIANGATFSAATNAVAIDIR
ncbi:MAG: hypothetical protein IPK26_22870 [Planctomycetes bacterium]|nr:hypothetical protein [Planctomycetota bacterium]